MTFPIYILKLEKFHVIFPQGKRNLSHPEFWENTVHKIVSAYFKIPAKKLFNLPYSQRRARIVNSKIYYGEKDCNEELLQLIRQTLNDDTLYFVYDDHEKRLKEDVRWFKRFIIPCR